MEAPRSMCFWVFAFIFVMPALTLGASTKPIPEQMKYIGISYDIIKGNPEGDAKIGGVDPGLLTTRRVLKLTYDDGRLTNDNEYRVPDQVEYTRGSSSYTSTEKDVFFGTKSYAEKLSHQVAVDVGVDAIFASFKFAASHEYKAVSNEEKSKGYVYFSEQTIKNFGEIRYKTTFAQRDGYESSREFRVAVCGLPLSYEKEPYMEFLTNWGTNVVTEATLGARSGTTYREDKSSFIRDSTREMSNSVSIGGSYKIVSGSLEMNMDTFRQNGASEEKFGKVQKEYEVGSEDYNEPISIELIGLNEVLDSKFWTKLDQYEECPANWPRETIQANILRAFKDYPSHIGVTASEDISVSMRLTWPNGKYALPEAAVLGTDTCPTNDDFTWEYSLIYQVTDGTNDCSKDNHLTNYCAPEDFRSYFCVKSTSSAATESWYWMPGVYCIYKVGNKCPKGFKDGSINWKGVKGGLDTDYSGSIAWSYSAELDFLQVEFCCREDGSTRNPIILPTDSSFYLMQYHTACQEVVGMNVTKEYLEWATARADPSTSQSGVFPRPGNTGHNVKIYYCFYQPDGSSKRELGSMQGEMKKELAEVRELVNLLENQLDQGEREEDAQQKKFEEELQARDLEALQRQAEREEDERLRARDQLLELLEKELTNLK